MFTCCPCRESGARQRASIALTTEVVGVGAGAFVHGPIADEANIIRLFRKRRRARRRRRRHARVEKRQENQNGNEPSFPINSFSIVNNLI